MRQNWFPNGVHLRSVGRKVKYSMHDDCWLLTIVVVRLVCICFTSCTSWYGFRRLYGALASAHRDGGVCLLRSKHVSHTASRFGQLFGGSNVCRWVCARATGGHFALLPTLRTSNDGISMWQKYCLNTSFFMCLFPLDSTVSYTVSHSAKYKLDSYEFNFILLLGGAHIGQIPQTHHRKFCVREKQSRFTQWNWCDKNKMCTVAVNSSFVAQRK